MYKYVIDGGSTLSGTVAASGNKNAALPCIAATLLTEEEVVLGNMPDIEDVHVMAKILADLGVAVEQSGPNTWRINSSRSPLLGNSSPDGDADPGLDPFRGPAPGTDGIGGTRPARG
jgi:UDP-N-acetylglucosamine enolpyruvyl transferase